MELMNSTQRVIAVLWESFKSTLFAVLVQVLLGQSDCDGGVRLGFKLKSLKRSCREIGFQSFLEHEGSGAIQDAALTLLRRVSSKGFIHITYAVLQSSAVRLFQKWPLRGFCSHGFSCRSRAFRFASFDL